MVNLGIIGYRNHAKRLIDIIEKNPEHQIKKIFHPTKNLDDSRSTNNLSELFSCDGIIISSPNSTHFNYLKSLDSFSGYIFCEKPPVVSFEELNWLEKLPEIKKQKIFFNFNYRFSDLNKIFKKYLNSKLIGDVIYIEIMISQGLAFKSEYVNSWRSDGLTNKFNLLDTLSIHFLDLVINNLGSSKRQLYFPNLIANSGTSYDFGHLILQYDKINVSILNSYVTPYLNTFILLGTNGVLTINDNLMKLRSPRDTFDEKNFFISPPIQEQKAFNMTIDYNTSLEKSIMFFLSHIQNKEFFDPIHFETSLKTTRLILELKSRF